MKHKLFTLLLAMIASVGTMFAETYSGSCGEDLTWSLNTEDSVLIIRGTGAMADFQNATQCPWNGYSSLIQSVIMNDNVTTVSNYAFAFCSNLKNVSLNKTLTTIGEHAFFSCPLLESVVIPDNVIVIGYNAFAQCSWLTSVRIGNKVTTIGKDAFARCGRLSSVVMFNSVTSIGENAFGNCSALTTINIPNSITSIGKETFAFCAALTSIEIPESVTSIGENAFYGCSGLTSVTNKAVSPQTINANVFTNINLSSCTLYVPAESVEAYKAAEIWKEFGNIVAIEGDAPAPCIIASGTCGAEGDNLTWTLSCDGVLTISGTGAMADYEYVDGGFSSAPWNDYRETISSLEFQLGVTSIGKYAFYQCRHLTTITLPSSVISIGRNAFDGCANLISATIPNSVTTIGWYAFSACTNLSSVTIPESVTELGIWPFQHCSGLTSIDVASTNPIYSSTDGVLFYTTESSLLKYPAGKPSASYIIPDNTTSISDYAFEGSTHLTSVTIPNSVTDIRSYAFRNCENLASLTIPNSVTRIGGYAFLYCTGLTSVICKAITPPTIASTAFYGVDISIPLYVPAQSVAAYQAADVWKEFGNILPIEDTPEPCITASGTCGAQGDNLTWTLTCDSVLTISGTGAMADYYSYESIPWYEYIYTANSIKSVIIQEGVTHIGQYAFRNCHLLASVSLANSLTSIGGGAFSYCGKLPYVKIPSSVTNLGIGVFEGCSSMSAFEVSEANPNFCSVDGVLFDKNISTLMQYPPSKTNTTYSIPSNVVTIAETAFWCSRNLTIVTIPNGVASIGSSAFLGCSGLTSVTIPNSVATIGQMPFVSCTNLPSIDVDPGNPYFCSIDGVLFNKNKTNLIEYPIGKAGTSYVIPDGVIILGNGAFEDCTSLISVTIPSSVESIGDFCFAYCRNLRSVTNYATLPQNIIGAGLSADTLYVPAQSVEAYKAADVWKDFGNILAIDDSTEEVNYATLADIYNMAADSTFTLGAFDVMYVPDFQSGSNMYIKDSTGSCVIYKVNYGLQAGDHVEAGLQGKVSIYNGLHEVIPITAKEDLTITHGEAPAPIVATEAPSLNNASQYVVYEGVSFTTDTAFVEGRRHTVYGSWNGQTITFYNQYYIGATLSANKTYNITAVNTIYRTTPQAYPLAVEEVTTDTLEPCLIASGTCGTNLTWELSCDSVLTISGTGEMENSDYSDIPWNSYRNSIKSLIIENGVTSINNYAFQHCKSLTYITIPNSVTKGLNYYACNEIISIDVESGNQNYSSIDGVLFNKSQTILMKYPSKNPRTEYSIPSSVTSVRNEAFKKSTNLISITIPNSVRNIGSYYPFSYCTSLISINVATDNPNYSSTDGVLFNKDKTSLIQYPGGKQGEYAIPNSVTSIGEGAFMGCAGLTSIEIPNSITSISSMVFDHCTSLSSVILPDGVTTIEYQAFYSCTNLTSVTIPSSVTSIENHVFSECSNLTLITNYAVEPQAVTQYMFMINWATNHLSNCTLYVPAQSIAAYQTADVWKEFGNILPIEEPIVEPTDSVYEVVYLDQAGLQLDAEPIILHLPVAPVIEGFSFLKWQVVAGDLENGIYIQAVYTANEPTNAPEVYTNPANHAKKLIRNGNVYILTDDKVYTITGQKIQSY